MARLTGKVAVVTGASKGIGAGIAKRLAAEGASVVVNYASSAADANRIVDDIGRAGGQAVAIGASVSSEDDVTQLFEQVRKAFGHVDVLVNNAGVYALGPIEDFSVSDFNRQFDTNVLGLLLTTKAALSLFPPMGGSIVNIRKSARASGPTRGHRGRGRLPCRGRRQLDHRGVAAGRWRQRDVIPSFDIP